jgi:hypothetical protein
MPTLASITGMTTILALQPFTLLQRSGYLSNGVQPVTVYGYGTTTPILGRSGEIGRSSLFIPLSQSKRDDKIKEKTPGQSPNLRGSLTISYDQAVRPARFFKGIPFVEGN